MPSVTVFRTRLAAPVRQSQPGPGHVLLEQRERGAAHRAQLQRGQDGQLDEVGAPGLVDEPLCLLAALGGGSGDIGKHHNQPVDGMPGGRGLVPGPVGRLDGGVANGIGRVMEWRPVMVEEIAGQVHAGGRHRDLADDRQLVHRHVGHDQAAVQPGDAAVGPAHGARVLRRDHRPGVGDEPQHAQGGARAADLAEVVGRDLEPAGRERVPGVPVVPGPVDEVGRLHERVAGRLALLLEALDDIDLLVDALEPAGWHPGGLLQPVDPVVGVRDVQRGQHELQHLADGLSLLPQAGILGDGGGRFRSRGQVPAVELVGLGPDAVQRAGVRARPGGRARRGRRRARAASSAGWPGPWPPASPARRPRTGTR